ncbi:hypothetical protein [Neochlamydia sp. AcF95]|uniref:hypothetical protein n=1 Tax=Neochlamydia sp. AcF95 TaxID=2795734 RepID=UPI001BC97FE7|nr:hypothetical protein [Neochlamydia sp. AcF95]MBS4171513.1 Uncharacterized protein [Neochlamydia sp. AcF95]
MNIFTVATAEDHYSISRLHFTPLSSKTHRLSQKLMNFYLESRSINLIALGSIACSVATSLLALAETVAALAYTIFLTSLNFLSFCRSELLQNHTVQAWGFCIQSFLMIQSPCLLISQLDHLSKYDRIRHEHFQKIKSAQIAQSLRAAFDFMSDDFKMIEDFLPSEAYGFAVAVEALPDLINKTKKYMPILRDVARNEFDPQKLADIDRFEFIEFLEDKNGLINPQQHLKLLANIPEDKNEQKELLELITLQLCKHQQYASFLFANPIFTLEQMLELNFRLPIRLKEGENFLKHKNLKKTNYNLAYQTQFQEETNDEIYQIFNFNEIPSPSIEKSEAAYEKNLEVYIKHSIKYVLSFERYINIFGVEQEGSYSKKEIVKACIQDLEAVIQINLLAILLELIALQKYRYKCPSQERQQIIERALIDYEAIKDNNKAKNLLIRMILQDKEFEIEKDSFIDKCTGIQYEIDSITRQQVQKVFRNITVLADHLHYRKDLNEITLKALAEVEGCGKTQA